MDPIDFIRGYALMYYELWRQYLLQLRSGLVYVHVHADFVRVVMDIRFIIVSSFVSYSTEACWRYSVTCDVAVMFGDCRAIFSAASFFHICILFFHSSPNSKSYCVIFRRLAIIFH